MTEKMSYAKGGFVRRTIGCLKGLTGVLLFIVSIYSLLVFYSTAYYLHKAEACRGLYSARGGHEGFDVKAFSERVDEVLGKMEGMQKKLETAMRAMEMKMEMEKANISRLEFKMYLQREVVQPLYDTHITLRQIRLPRVAGIRSTSFKEEPLINSFTKEEIKTYITPKENRQGKLNIYGTERVYNTIGHACVLVKRELEVYMSYDSGGNCKDDWNLAQKLMLHGCDPLPRRRCVTRGPQHYRQPHPVNESLWKTPDDRNVRWNNFHCKDFKCLSALLEKPQRSL